MSWHSQEIRWASSYRRMLRIVVIVVAAILSTIYVALAWGQAGRTSVLTVPSDGVGAIYSEVGAGIVTRITSAGAVTQYQPTARTKAANGVALTAAVDALVAGDTLIISPAIYEVAAGTLTPLAGLLIDTNNVRLVGNGATITPAAEDYDFIVYVSGDDVHIENLRLQGTGRTDPTIGGGTALTLRGEGMRILGDRFYGRAISVASNLGADATGGDDAFQIVTGADQGVLESCRSWDAGDTGVTNSGKEWSFFDLHIEDARRIAFSGNELGTRTKIVGGVFLSRSGAIGYNPAASKNRSPAFNFSQSDADKVVVANRNDVTIDGLQIVWLNMASSVVDPPGPVAEPMMKVQNGRFTIRDVALTLPTVGPTWDDRAGVVSLQFDEGSLLDVHLSRCVLPTRMSAIPADTNEKRFVFQDCIIGSDAHINAQKNDAWQIMGIQGSYDLIMFDRCVLKAMDHAFHKSTSDYVVPASSRFILRDCDLQLGPDAGTTANVFNRVSFANVGLERVFTSAAVNTTSDTITLTAHGFLANDLVQYVTDDTAATPLKNGHTYFVVSPAANTVQLALTRGGTALDLTATGSGTMRLRALGGVEIQRTNIAHKVSGGQVNWSSISGAESTLGLFAKPLHFSSGSGTYFPGSWPVGFTTTKLLTAERVYMRPIYLERAVAIDQIVCEVTTSATGNLRVGLWSSNRLGHPDIKLTESVNTADGVGVIAQSYSAVLPPGLYWGSVVADVGTTMRAQSVQDAVWGSTNTSVITANIYKAITFGTSTTSPFGTFTFENATAMPLVMLRERVN